MLQAQSEDIKEHINMKTDPIAAQAAKTNGRVTWLEKMMWLSIGGIGVLSAVLLPVLGWALSTLVNIDDQIEMTVQNTIEDYQFEVVE